MRCAGRVTTACAFRLSGLMSARDASANEAVAASSCTRAGPLAGSPVHDGRRRTHVRAAVQSRLSYTWVALAWPGVVRGRPAY
eukprot:3854140-Prymnesium_polylepis.2